MPSQHARLSKSSLKQLREDVLDANLELVRRGLVLYTFGNASGIDRGKGLVVIKPSGVPYAGMKPQHMVVVALDTGKVVEGHAEHVMDAVAPDLLPSLPKLRTALDQRRRSQKGLSRLLARLLGMDLKLKQYERGKIFCDAVVTTHGPAALHRVFSSPEALPTLAEIEDPAAWMARSGLTEPTEPAQRSSA